MTLCVVVFVLFGRDECCARCCLGVPKAVLMLADAAKGSQRELF